MNKIRIITILILTILTVTTAVHLNRASSQPTDSISNSGQQAYGQMPLLFVQNQGQWADQVAYAVQGSDKTLYFTPEGVTFVLSAWDNVEALEESASIQIDHRVQSSKPVRSQRHAVKFDFLGANPNIQPIGQAKDNAVISYFNGQPDNWHTAIPTYRRIVYPNLWPGIDLVYEGTVNRLKYHFLVHPHADPSQIKLVYRGASDVYLNAAGKLIVETPLGRFEDDAPIAYQEVDGKQLAVDMSYVLEQKTADTYPYHFSVGAYDPNQPLVLDPALLLYAGYLGAQNTDEAFGVAADSTGSAYVTGFTELGVGTFPPTAGPTESGGADLSAFIAKVEPDGTGLIYAAYIDGSGTEKGKDIAIDSNGNAYIAGWTSSTQTTFPVTVGPDMTQNGDLDAFVAKLDATGTNLIYAGFIGGVDEDKAYGIDIDVNGNAYVTGRTHSEEDTFPTLVGPFLTNSGREDAFVTKVNSSGSGLIYSGFLGGSDEEIGWDIAVDGTGNAYVVGRSETNDDTFPVLVGPDLDYNGGMNDGFVAKINASGSGLIYAGFIGGVGIDDAFGIDIDDAGFAYIVGETTSTETTFPVLVGPDLTQNGINDAYVLKLNQTGTNFIYSGFLGGDKNEEGNDIKVDQYGNVYIAGSTNSSEATFPVQIGPDLTPNGFLDAFVAKISPSGSNVLFASYLGGGNFDFGHAIAIDGNGNVFMVGETFSGSGSFPVTIGPDLTHGGQIDGYVARFRLLPHGQYLPLVIKS